MEAAVAAHTAPRSLYLADLGMEKGFEVFPPATQPWKQLWLGRRGSVSWKMANCSAFWKPIMKELMTSLNYTQDPSYF